MKIGFIAGHSNRKVGASGNGYQEHILVREIANKCIEYANNNYKGTFLTDDVNSHSGGGEEDFVINNKLDYFLSIHLNAGTSTANGTEILVSCKEKTTGIEQNIVDNLASQIGFKNRGIKRREQGGNWVNGYKNVNDYYGILRTPKNKGISGSILEICFISNIDDLNKLLNNKDKIAKIIVDNICNGFKLEKKTITSTNTSTNTNNKIYRTVIFSGSYENAVKMKNEAMLKGFKDAFIVEK